MRVGTLIVGPRQAHLDILENRKKILGAASTFREYAVVSESAAKVIGLALRCA